MIIAMKKAKIVVLKEDKEKLLSSLQRYGELMIIPVSENDKKETSGEESIVSRANKTLKLMQRYGAKKKLTDYYEISYEDFIKEDHDYQELLHKIESNDEEIEKLNAANQVLNEKISFILPYKDLNIALDRLDEGIAGKIHVGVIEKRNYQNLVDSVKDFGGALELLSETPSIVTLVYAAYIEDDQVLLDKVKGLGFNETLLPNEPLLAKDYLAALQNDLEVNLNKIKGLKDELTTLAQRRNELEHLSDQVNSKIALKKVDSLQTIETSYFEGWVRTDRVDRLTDAIKQATDIYDLEISDPAEGEMPPTFTKNNQFVAPFEIITDMFSSPSPYEVDPNPVMSIWYWIIFGIMMGDAGYGLILFLGAFAMIKITKPKGNTLKLYRIFLYSSITTIIWGIVFGSYFGYSLDKFIKGAPKSLVDPIGNPIQMLVLSLIIGAMHIISGLLVKIYAQVRNGNIIDAIFDQVSWILIILGLGLLFLPAPLSNVGMYTAGVGAVIVLFTAGRHKKNIFGKTTGGMVALYAVTGYISDILSYSRLLALVLSSAAVAMVMNLLAEMVQGSVIGFFFSLLIYILGHAFNLVMGMLSAYVHDGRLQYIEFFGKFFEGGGYQFEPLTYKLNYIDKINDAEIMKGDK